MRRFWFQAHLWAGLGCGSVLAVIGLTGALYAFEREARAVWGERVAWTAPADLASPHRLKERFAEQGIKGEPRWLLWPRDPEEPLWVRFEEASGEMGDYQVDPISGTILPRATALHRFFQANLEVHRYLTMGEVGRVLTGTSALLLPVLALSGVELVWGRRWRKAWTPQRAERRHTRRKVRWRAWHRVVGLWSLPVALLLALSGPVFGFSWYKDALVWLGDATQGRPWDTGAPATTLLPAPLAKLPTPHVQAEASELERLWARVLPLVPDPGRPFRLILPADPSKPAHFGWSPESAPWENFRSGLNLDRRSGEVVSYAPLDQMSPGEQWRRWAYPIHTGRIFGAPTQFIALLGALSLPVLFGGGVYLAFAHLFKSRQGTATARAATAPSPSTQSHET